MLKDSAFNKLREEEREVRRQLIIEATLNLLERKSFDQIGMRDIASEAGISPASLYRYFPGQTDLLMESFLYDMEGIIEKLKKKIATKEISTIEDFAKKFVDTLMESEATFQMMSYMMIKADISKDLLKKFNSMMKTLFSNIEHVFKISGIECDGRSLVHTFFASLAGIVMTFRNFPVDDRESLHKHIIKLAVISSFSHSRSEVLEFVKNYKS